MGKKIVKLIINVLGWIIISLVLAGILVGSRNLVFKDIIFIEGIFLIIIGLTSTIGGDPLGLSLQGLGNMNEQYMANANLEGSKMEKEKNNYQIKTTMKIFLSTTVLVISGLILILINFFI